MRCSDCNCELEVHSEDGAALMPCAGCRECHGFTFPKFKWEDAGYREDLETTTEAMQYHWGEGARFLASAPNQTVGRTGLKWAGEILVNGQWQFVGEFRTGREAKAAVVEAFQRQVLEGSNDDEFNPATS